MTREHHVCPCAACAAERGNVRKGPDGRRVTVDHEPRSVHKVYHEPPTEPPIKPYKGGERPENIDSKQAVDSDSK